MTLVGALAATMPGAANAQDVGVVAGPYVSFTFGEEVGVGWGLDTTFIVAPGNASDSCGDGLGSSDYGFGGAFQLGAINFSTLRLVAALTGGGALGTEQSVALLGEAGLALHLEDQKKPQAGIHTGLVVQSPLYMHGFVRAEWLLDEYSVGGGARFPQLFNREAECAIGRPLRGADGAVAGRCAARVAGRRPTVGRARPPRCNDAGAIGRAWADDAQGEAASVPAFLQLAAELLAHDAPDSLVAAALDAAEDEVRHARLCAGQASRFTGRRVAAVAPSASLRAPLGGRSGLVRLAVESWVDGCLSEGAAAARAGFAAAHATDGGCVASQRTIARDESAHAELGWSVLRWAMARGGADVTDAVRALRDAPPPEVGPASDEPRDALAFGRVPRHLAEQLHEGHTLRARRRLDQVLASA